LLNQQFARKFLYHTAFSVVLYKGIVFLCSALGKRLEPVRVVGNAVFVGPLLHAFGYSIGYSAVELHAIVDNINQFFVHISGQILVHSGTIKDLSPKKFGRALHWSNHLNGSFARSLRHCFET